VVRAIRAGGTIRQGRRYDPSGQVLLSSSARASGVISQAGGAIRQGRRYDPSGQAV
jgi:hypothetical protein